MTASTRTSPPAAAAQAGAVPARPRRRGAGLASALPQLVALALVLAACRAVSPQFFDVRLQDGRLFGSLVDVLYRGAPVALLSIGMCVVIAGRGIDLSVGAIMAIAGAVAATLVDAGQPWPLCVLAALGVGVVCGLWNGLLVAVLAIQPIVATLILMVAGRGLAQLVTGGQIVTFDDPGLIGVAAGSVFGVPLPVAITAAVLALAALLLRGTALGLFLEATGANAAASRLAGVETRLVTVATYVASGLCAATAGLVAAGDIHGADANNAGLWLELNAILAVVVGGGSLLGGRFSLVRSVLGALIIQAMGTGILLSGFQPEFNLIVEAVVVLAVLLAQSPALAGMGRALLARRRG